MYLFGACFVGPAVASVVLFRLLVFGGAFMWRQRGTKLEVLAVAVVLLFL